MGKDKYTVLIKLNSLGDAQFPVGDAIEERDIALRIYGEIRKNYSFPRNVSLTIRENDSERSKEVVLSDIEVRKLFSQI